MSSWPSSSAAAGSCAAWSIGRWRPDRGGAPVEIAAPDITAWRDGNTGIPYVTTLDSGRAGPHAVITALVHGNELCGAWALVRLLERGVRPSRGRLSLAFVNTAAYERFDPANPKLTRYLDEDLNRVWDRATLEGPRRSAELERARAIRPLIEAADYLLDLHSMQLPAPPLLLCGLADKGRRLARALGYPGLRGGGCRAPERRPDARLRRLRRSGAARARPCWSNAASTGRRAASRSRSRPAGSFSRHSIWRRPQALAALADAPAPVAAQRVIEVTHAVTVERRAVPLHRGLPGARGDRAAGHGDRA